MKFRIAFLIFAVLAMVGCSHDATVNPPPPPQLTLMQADKLLADACNAAATTVIQLRDIGKLSQADTVTIERYVLALSKFSDEVATTANNGAPWATQRQQLIEKAANLAPPAVAIKDPTAAALVAQLTTIALQLKAVL